jgi:hypothetical protein
MQASVQCYRSVLGMELLYGGEQASFSSLRANDPESAILNLERGDTVSRWGRLIFHVADVDAFWIHLKERGFDPEIPRDASACASILCGSAGAVNRIACAADSVVPHGSEYH